MAACTKFVPFANFNDVCNTCGELADSHSTFSRYSEYRADLWKILLKHGSVHNYYGGTDTFRDLELRVHLGLELNEKQRSELHHINSYFWGAPSQRLDIPDVVCEIDWEETGDPELGHVLEFVSSEDDSATVTAVVGQLTCKCHKFWMFEVSLVDKTMGQLMWLVVKEGEKREG